MVLRSRPTSGRLALLTGIFGLTWNLGSFVIYGLAGLGVPGPLPFLTAIAFGALGFLPAAVVQSAAGLGANRPYGWRRIVVITGYAMSAVATVMHLYSSAVYGVAPSQIALRGLIVGFAVLLAALLVPSRRQEGWARSLWVAALAVFAVSALHLSANHGGEDPWWLALVGHHASLGLVLAILYQDYRFALADLFLKRALSLFLLVGLVFGVYTLGAVPLLSSSPLPEVSRLLLLFMWTATALVYPFLQRGVHWFVDRVILGRGNYGQLLSDTFDALGKSDTVESVLTTASSILQRALSSQSVTWTELLPGAAQKADAVVHVPTAETPQFVLHVGPLAAGRRLLSDDQTMVERFSVIVGRRIDGIRAANERYEISVREEEVRKLAAEAELRALRAQINPHFLFNTLTTIGYLIQVSPQRALATLMRLSGLLRSVLKPGGEFVTLGEELDLVEGYLEIEKARFEDRLRIDIDVPPEARNLRLPALILQPLVENAIKHGISRSMAGGIVQLTARMEDRLILTITDIHPGDCPSSFEMANSRGVGLENVRRRLQYHGGSSAGLFFRKHPAGGTIVEVRYPLEFATTAVTEKRA